MDATAFLRILRKRPTAPSSVSLENPLEEIWRLVEEINGDRQSGYLFSVAAWVTDNSDEFDEGTAYALDLEYLPLVCRLIEARLSGEIAEEEWIRTRCV